MEMILSALVLAVLTVVIGQILGMIVAWLFG